MHYDPIKNKLGQIFNLSPVSRKIFYHLLDLLLLRTWHIHKEINKWNNPFKPAAHILDAGSGFGQYTYFLHNMNPNWNILAVDVKSDQVGECNLFFHSIGAYSVLFKTADLVKFNMQNNFEFILSVDVMEHIEEDEKVFRNFCTALKPGGMLLISTPSDKGGSDVKDSHDTSFIEEHVRDGYNAQEIADKLRRAGFARVKTRYSYGRPGQISWKLSMKIPMKLLNASSFFLYLLPFYYLIVFPFAYLLNYMDTHMAHRSGTGLIVKAWK